MIISGLKKSYLVSGHCLTVLKGLDLELADQGITVVLGRSGCGKTTLLRLIAGLEPADAGKVSGFEPADAGKTNDLETAGSERNTGSQEALPSHEARGKETVRKEKIGVIFQEPRLMPWLSVERNILFGVKKKERNKEKLSYLLRLTGLTGFEKARPFQLSGGMQQRVALARALAYEPDFLLMDEPFAALDYFTRAQMQQELLRIYQTEKKGILFVTHSIEEALTVGTQIVVLEDGICKKSYDLREAPFPRDLLSEEMAELKRKLIWQIGEQKGRN